MERQYTNLGSVIKYAISLKCTTLTASDFDWKVRAWTYSNRYVDIEKSEAVYDEDSGQYILPIDTSRLSEGTIRLTVTAQIPDSDESSGYRQEIETYDTHIGLRRKVGE